MYEEIPMMDFLDVDVRVMTSQTVRISLLTVRITCASCIIQEPVHIPNLSRGPIPCLLQPSRYLYLCYLIKANCYQDHQAIQPPVSLGSMTRTLHTFGGPAFPAQGRLGFISRTPTM